MLVEPNEEKKDVLNGEEATEPKAEASSDETTLAKPETLEAEKSTESKEEPKPTIEKQLVTHFLVKWRSLPYDESTWELEKDIDSDKIKEFYERREIPRSKVSWRCFF